MHRRLHRAATVAVVALTVLSSHASAQPAAAYRPAADRLIDAATRDSAAWLKIAELTDTFGPRVSGSAALERAIDWTLERMRADGLENVRGERAMVRNWVRGAESAELITPRRKSLAMLGLGGSVGTRPGGITAPVLVVSSFDELTARAAEAKGKIVLFDVPFTDYEATRVYRTGGASAAAKVGAVAMLLRSVASFSMNTPHTGGMRYDSTVARIPAAAITVEDAMLLHRMQLRGQPLTVKLVMGARELPRAASRNVVAELRGREKPDEIVVIGGHIDSWDVGQGAMDDAGGVVAAWEAVRLMKALGLRPRRTVRVVGWTNEEGGVDGGKAYAAAHAGEVAKHVFALESDNGVFRPYGIQVVGTDSAMAMLRRIAPLLARIGADSVTRGGGEADIEPLLTAGVPGAGLHVETSRYFWYHHTNADTPDKLDPRDVARCVAVFAVYAYVLAEMPELLPRTR
ncbi:MAG TPA: M28 family metallopeptidase [Gemmatimonadaceae bacterium]|nr:M28 family metallopeptidase [Gemmatimonadaceae bacterium]